MSRKPASPPIRILCETCGSDQVSRDAFADWNVATQSWELGFVFDDAACHQCDTRTHLIEMPVEDEPDASAAASTVPPAVTSGIVSKSMAA